MHRFRIFWNSMVAEVWSKDLKKQQNHSFLPWMRYLMKSWHHFQQNQYCVIKSGISWNFDVNFHLDCVCLVLKKHWWCKRNIFNRKSQIFGGILNIFLTVSYRYLGILMKKDNKKIKYFNLWQRAPNFFIYQVLFSERKYAPFQNFLKPNGSRGRGQGLEKATKP